MVLFTKVYGELSLRIQQSLPRCNNRGAFRAAEAGGCSQSLLLHLTSQLAPKWRSDLESPFSLRYLLSAVG